MCISGLTIPGIRQVCMDRIASATDSGNAACRWLQAPGRRHATTSNTNVAEVCNVFMAVVARWPARERFQILVERTNQNGLRHTFSIDMARPYPCAEKITLVMDNLNTHGPGSLYETFELPTWPKRCGSFRPPQYTPKHGQLAFNSGRDRTQRPHQAMPGPQDRQSRFQTPQPKWRACTDPVDETIAKSRIDSAVYQSRCPNQAHCVLLARSLNV